MTQVKLTKEQRAEVIDQLQEFYPEKKFGRTSGAKLIEMLQEAIDESEGENKMSSVLKKYRPTYAVSVTANGRKSRYNADDVAQVLEGVEPLTVVKAAEKLLGLKRGELQTKYEGMNNGQIRMNAGNRLRGAVKRGDLIVEEIEKVLKKA